MIKIRFRYYLCATGLLLLAAAPAHALCVPCPGGGYSCGMLPAGPPPCSTPEQYTDWKTCLKNNHVAFLHDLSTTQQKAVLDCDKKYAKSDTCMTKHPPTQDSNEAFAQCEKDQGLERSRKRSACVHKKDPAFPDYVYELEPRKYIPAIHECDSIPHGSQ